MPEESASPFLDGAKIDVPLSALYMVMATIFIDTLAGAISTPVIPYYTQSFGVSKANIGFLYASWSLSSTVFAPVLSRMADKWGRRPVLIMALVGAGVSNLIQGFSLFFKSYTLFGTDAGFLIFLFGRFTSGIWAAVGSTCNVYVTDVCKDLKTRDEFLGKMSVVPLLAIVFGPGIGGGLAELGLNVPVVVDGIITLIASIVVAVKLPETPAFLASKLESKDALSDNTPHAAVKMGYAVHLLGFAQFLGGIAFSTMLSVFGIFMQEKYQFNALKVGFSFTSSAIVMIASNVLVVPRIRKRLRSAAQLHCVGCAIFGVFLGVMAVAPTLSLSLLAFLCCATGSAMRMASSSAVVARYTDTSSRGKIFGLIQLYTNAGRFVGPLVMTHVAASVGVWVPFVIAGGIAILSGYLTLVVDDRAGPKDADAVKGKQLERRKTTFGDSWMDEEGSKEDVEALGKFMAKILKERHYKWVTRRAEVETLLDRILPELHTSDREAYEESLHFMDSVDSNCFKGSIR